MSGDFNLTGKEAGKCDYCGKPLKNRTAYYVIKNRRCCQTCKSQKNYEVTAKQKELNELRKLCIAQAEYIEWLQSNPELKDSEHLVSMNDIDHWERIEPVLPSDYGIQVNAVRRALEAESKATEV